MLESSYSIEEEEEEEEKKKTEEVMSILKERIDKSVPTQIYN
jgi:hypothetical protein